MEVAMATTQSSSASGDTQPTVVAAGSWRRSCDHQGRGGTNIACRRPCEGIRCKSNRARSHPWRSLTMQAGAHSRLCQCRRCYCCCYCRQHRRCRLLGRRPASHCHRTRRAQVPARCCDRASQSQSQPPRPRRRQRRHRQQRRHLSHRCCCCCLLLHYYPHPANPVLSTNGRPVALAAAAAAAAREGQLAPSALDEATARIQSHAAAAGARGSGPLPHRPAYSTGPLVSQSGYCRCRCRCRLHCRC